MTERVSHRASQRRVARVHTLTWRTSGAEPEAAGTIEESPHVTEALKGLVRLLGRQAARRMAREYAETGIPPQPHNI